MVQRSNSSRSRSVERAINSSSLSRSSTMSSGSGGRSFMTSMSLIFNMEFQFEKLQLMKDKLLSTNGDVYATFIAEKLKRSFGLRALPSLEESQPIITFEGDTDDDISFTLVYYNSRETSPLNYVLKHYFGSQFIETVNEVYTLLYDNTLNTSATASEVTEGENEFNRDVDDVIDDLELEIEEEEESEVSRTREEFRNHEIDDSAHHGSDVLPTEDDLSTFQKESIDGHPLSGPMANGCSNAITERQASIAATAIVKNPQIIENPSTSSAAEKSKYSIKYCDTNKLIINKKGSYSSSTVLNDFNSLPGRGLREHLLFPQNRQMLNKNIYTPNPSSLAVSPINRDYEMAKSPRIDVSPPMLQIDDEADPDWSPRSVSKTSKTRRSSDHLRSALTSVRRTSSDVDGNPTKRWVCNFKNCGKTFSVRSHLDTHKVTHTGEKRYICNICGGRFTQSSSLRNHRIAIHTKDYPHNCNICKKGFLLPSQLKKHRLSYHGSRKHLNNYNSTTSHANALAAKILATAKSVPTVPPVPTLWSSRDAVIQHSNNQMA